MSEPTAFDPLAETIVDRVCKRLHQQGLPLQAEWLNPEQAAIYTSVSTKTLEEYRRRKQHLSPPYSRVGSKIRYKRTDLDKWLTALRVKESK